MESFYYKGESILNKTKKYTLVFVILCFVLIGGAGIYHTCFPNQEEKEVVEIKEENEVEQQVTDSQQETIQQNEPLKEKQTVQKEEKKAQKKTESQQTTSSKKDDSKQEESKPKQPVQETPKEIEQETDEIEEKVTSVNVTITGVEGVIAQDYIEYEEGMSAYDALKVLAENYGITIKSSGLGQAVYVKGINGLMEFDYGGQSGWKYMVNGSYPSVSAGAYMLKADDQVEWVYTTNG